VPSGTDRRVVAAQPDRHAPILRNDSGDGVRGRGRLAPHGRSGDGELGGTYTFVARRQEVLRRRGQNLSPTQVEEAIQTHPDVLEVAVVPIASELTEDEVKAFVVPEPGHVLDFVELRAWTAERLSAFKVPRFWQAVDALTRTPTSRVAKHRLPGGHPPDEYDAEAASDDREAKGHA
jgi:acyl-CoA synthetase (AMP-forming)/AMP-acid ligase II